MSDKPEALCQLCGEAMPPGEEMFNYHGYSGPCPKPPLPRPAREMIQISNLVEGASKKIREMVPAHNWQEHLWLDMVLQELVEKTIEMWAKP